MMVRSLAKSQPRVLKPVSPTFSGEGNSITVPLIPVTFQRSNSARGREIVHRTQHTPSKSLNWAHTVLQAPLDAALEAPSPTGVARSIPSTQGLSNTVFSEICIKPLAWVVKTSWWSPRVSSYLQKQQDKKHCKESIIIKFRRQIPGEGGGFSHNGDFSS